MLIQHLYFPKSKDTALYIMVLYNCYYGIQCTCTIFKMLGKMLPVFQMALLVFTVLILFFILLWQEMWSQHSECSR